MPGTDPLTDVASEDPAARAAFNLDYFAWHGTLSDRDSRLATILATGERNRTAGKRVGLDHFNVSRKRAEFKRLWEEFTA